MTKNLMIFAIGPVQEFIATARRSRDLWYGSWMLSELSKAAAKRIVELSGELIFPYPFNPRKDLEPESRFTAPNKIVAIMDGDPKSVAEHVHKEIITRRDMLWQDAKRNIKGKFNEDMAGQQIEDLVEFYWVSVPLEEAGDYGKAREQAEALMAARKVTRDYKQPKWSAPSPKSSLDGARESVIPESEYPERGDPNNKQLKKKNDEKIERLYKNYHARRGEQLSGVDLLKRVGAPHKPPVFLSTSDIAAYPFIQWLDGGGENRWQKLLEELRMEIEKYRPSDEVEKLEDSMGLVFESRYADSLPLQELSPAQKTDFTALLEKYAGKKKPDPYYALLAADGDFMGRVIDGQESKKKHQDISKALAGFATAALAVVEDHHGIPIYSGGDDVLAYLPLNSVLKCAQELEAKFRTLLVDFQVTEGGKTIIPTLSIGIVIVHHLEPLSDALELVRKAEKDAKSVEGKNGLAIILSKRSGADRPIVDQFAALKKRLDRMIEWYGRDAISGGAAYELLELHRALSRTNIDASGKSAEAARIIARKRESGSTVNISTDVKDAFKEWIAAVRLDELAREMIVANTLAGKQEAE